MNTVNIVTPTVKFIQIVSVSMPPEKLDIPDIARAFAAHG